MGFKDKILNPILKTLLFPLKPIIDPIITVGDMMKQLFEILLTFIKMIPKLKDIFYYVTDPLKMIRDFFFGIKMGIIMIFTTLVDMLFGNIMKKVSPPNMNTNGSDSKNKDSKDKESLFCAKPSLLKVILLLLCPPLALFVEMGLKGFFHIVLASILTYFYYFPGLIYASMFIL